MSEETRQLDELRPHPENAHIFGDPEESEQYEAIKASIKQHGIWEPIVIKTDGTILSGHLRYHVAQSLKLKSVPVRVAQAFETYRDEVTFIIRANTDRRQLTKAEIAIAFKRLRELPKEDGGAKPARGRPKKGAAERTFSGTKARDEAADLLGVGRDEAVALETVFTTPGVPDELKEAVNKGKVAATPAAKAVRAELKRQDGEIKDPAALKVISNPAPKKPRAEQTHVDEVAAKAEAFERDYRELFDLYRRVDAVLTHRPLKSVIGPTEHHQYLDLIRDTALRAWREIESVQGPTNTGRQMSLSVVQGGKS